MNSNDGSVTCAGMDNCALNQSVQQAVPGVHPLAVGGRQPATSSANYVLPALVVKHNSHRLHATHIPMLDPPRT